MALASEQSIRDQTNPNAQTFFETAFIRNEEPGEDPNVLFAEEYPGKWKGYIEWQNYPEKRAKAAEILARHKFPPPPEFQSAIPHTRLPTSEIERY
jgi:sulfite oxidase